MSFAIGDKIIYKDNGVVADIIDIRDNSVFKEVYLKIEMQGEMDFPWTVLQEAVEKGLVAHVKQIKFDEDLFTL